MRNLRHPAAAGLAALLALATTTSAAGGTATRLRSESTATVTVTGMVYVPDGSTEGAVPDLPSETFTVSGAAESLDTLVQKRVREASERIAAGSGAPSGGASTQSSNYVFGSCGSSYVILRGTGSYTQGQGYVEAGFTLKGVTSTGAYSTDTLIYSNAPLDLWTAHLKDSGNLAGRLSWSKGSRVTIPKTQDYGAHFYVGTVAVTVNGQAGTCSTIGPRVDNVYLYK